jgi:hypothetical protein
MTEIWQLPIDNFATITGFLDGFEICRLWLGGNQRLMARLENGGVTRFDITLSQTVSRKWPTVVSQFRHLDSLRIVPTTKNHRIWFSGVDFGSISPTLKHLELELEYLTLNLLGLPITIADPHPDPIWSPKTEGKLEMSPFPMKSHFQNLETVIFRSRLLAPDIVVPMLPKSILKLHLTYACFSPAAWAALPPNLTHLELPFMRSLPEHPYCFPSGLTHLDLRSLHLVSNSKDLAQFPKSLVHLDLISCLHDVTELAPLADLLSNSNQTDGPRLPASFLHLRAQSLLKPEILHSNLQTLHISNLRASNSQMALLPRTLTDLAVGGENFDSACIEFLPPNLRSLSMYLRFRVPSSSSPYPFLKSLENLNVRRLDLAAIRGATKLKRVACLRLSF